MGVRELACKELLAAACGSALKPHSAVCIHRHVLPHAVTAQHVTCMQVRTRNGAMHAIVCQAWAQGQALSVKCNVCAIHVWCEVTSVAVTVDKLWMAHYMSCSCSGLATDTARGVAQCQWCTALFLGADMGQPGARFNRGKLPPLLTGLMMT